MHGNLTSAGVSVGTVSGELHAAPASDAHRRALSSRSMIIVGALTVLAAVLRFAGLGHQGFWFDEGNTALLVHFSPGKMLGLIPQSESTPPLYYGLAWIWVRIFGYGEAGLRSLSALAGVATVPVAYGAARKLISERAGLIAAALTACNPFLIWYSQEARSYSLLVLLTSLALLAFAYARAEPTPRVLAAWVIASAAALATHYYALLAIVPQAVWLLAAHWRRRGVQVAVGAVGLCGLALIPLALSQNHTGNSGWIGKIALGPRLGQIIPHFLIGTGAPAYDVLEPLAAADGDRVVRAARGPLCTGSARHRAEARGARARRIADQPRADCGRDRRPDHAQPDRAVAPRRGVGCRRLRRRARRRGRHRRRRGVVWDRDRGRCGGRDRPLAPAPRLARGGAACSDRRRRRARRDGRSCSSTIATCSRCRCTSRTCPSGAIHNLSA